jgi:uncharacterized membrane protein
MKKFWRINASTIEFGLAGWLVITTVIAGVVHNTGWWPLKILLFLCLAFLPGVALLRTLRITPRTYSTGVLYSFGLSVLVLILSGLVANQLLPVSGVDRPLEFWRALGMWGSVTALIIATGILTNSRAVRLPKWSIKKVPKLAWLLFLFSILLPCIATAGAFRLNNGGDGTFAMATLVLATGFIACIVLVRRRLSDGLLTWLIFSIGLTLLLMTSLRGWDILGHDIEREFRVYTLTHMHALWDIGLDRDPYNACLSITILPEMFARLLDIPGLVVFKVILQIIFAACPAVIYILLRQYAPKLGALTGCVLFMCYPTFINDSAMLTRQGVAYLFFALALLVVSTGAQEWRHKLLFLLFALGAILSHYSTAYMFVALFAVAVICKLLISWWLILRKRPLPRTAGHTIVSPLFAVLLFAMTFAWYAQITGTSSGLAVTLSKSFANIPKTFSNDNKSSDTSTALLFASSKTQADIYQSYLTDTQPRNKTGATADSQFIPTLVGDALPLTPLGIKALAIGINPSIITTLRQNFAKVLQVLALLGVLYATYRLLRSKATSLGPDLTCLSLAGIALLALLVILPVVSINYGVLRAFQQALIFLIIPITLLLVTLGQRMSIRIVTTLTTTGMVFLFLLFTGMFAQLLGGVSPSLSMNNQGLYYGLYHSSEADARGLAWLRAHIPKGQDVRAANFNRAFMHDPRYPFTRSGILPSQVGTTTYVYLDPAQVETQRVHAYYESSPLIMTFPLDYYDATKNKIYSTATTRIYR